MLDAISAAASSVQSSETCEDIRRLYQCDLLSVKQIAYRLSLPPTIARNCLKVAHIPIRTKAELSLLRRNRFLPEKQLRYLYQQQRRSASQIAQQLRWSRQHIVNRLHELNIPLRSAADACTVYPKTPFEGDRATRAYLTGFRTGDLHVKRLNAGGKTIWVECASTRTEQIGLFLRLFQTYGRCWVGRPKRSGARGMHALLDESFSFLLPKARAIESWILKDRHCFAAFLAGYVDAEGHFAVYGGQPVFAVQSYDRQILVTCAQQLQMLGVSCRPPRMVARPGAWMNSKGYSNRKTVWRFQIAQQKALLQLIHLLQPYLQHAKRRKDMLKVERCCTRSRIP